MAKRNEDELAVGEDSFMDTIANLVGIMIILVVIVGAKGYAAARTSAREQAHDQIEQLKSPASQAENLRIVLEVLAFAAHEPSILKCDDADRS